jgi:hypothetical protein
MKRYFRFSRNAVAVLATASAVTYPSPVGSSTSSSAISIDPRINALVDPGQTVKGQLSVTNGDATAPLYLNLKVIDFTYTNDTGTAKLYIAKNAPQTTWSLKPYLSLPNELTIPAGGTASIPYTIKIPSNLAGGSYYSAIEYASGLGTGGYLGLSASGVTLMFVNVSGPVHEKLAISKFGAYTETNPNDAGTYNSYITSHAPNSLAFKVKNSGNAVESPAGSIIIKKWGHTYKTIGVINPESLLTLIGQTRLYVPCIKSEANETRVNTSIAQSPDLCIKSGLAPGHYSATLEVYYGQNGNPTQEVIATTSFWYIPIWLVILIIIILLIIIYIGYRIYQRIKEMTGGGNGTRGMNRGGHSYRLPKQKKGRSLRR